jgi:ATP-dependent exoDNAse (exonuclease V) beta subunit
LTNDSATIAIEIPVFLTPKEARTEGISIPKTLTGHIDILQVRNNRIQVLDYKPDAEHDKKAPQQLNLYALALSKRAQIPLKSINCAYFDENGYFQFIPIL